MPSFTTHARGYGSRRSPGRRMGIRPPSRDTLRPRFANSFALKNERAQGRPGARCTRGLACQDAQSKTHTSIQVQRKQSGLPCAMVLTAYFRALPGETRACLSPSPARSVSSPANLTPAIGASGPHDFAVRISRARQSQPPRPPLPAPTSVTMANAPSLGTGWRGISR
jgi:hypothetical protein